MLELKKVLSMASVTMMLTCILSVNLMADSRPDLVVAVTKLTPHFDPMGSNSNVNERVGENIVENLIRYDWKTGKLIPGLATSWKMKNNTTLVLQIRDGVMCHDGSKFTAKDVEIMFGPKRYNGKNAPGYKIGKPFLNTIKSVRAIDGNKVEITTSKPDPLLLNRLSGWMGQVPCSSAYLKSKSWEQWGQKVIGTGPYKISKVKPGELQQLTAFDNYWGKKAPAKTITYKVVPETAARIAGLISGEYDIITEIQPDQFKTIAKHKDLEIAGGPIRNIRIIAYDTKNPILKNTKIRRAMNLAINRKLLVSALFDGKTTVPNGMQMKSFGKMYIADFKGTKYNPEKAKELLKEAGYNGEEISYRYLKDYYTGEVSTAQILQQMWKKVGLNIKLELKENWGQIEEDKSAKGRGVINWSSSAYLNDPIGQIYRMFGPDEFFQVHNFWNGTEFNKAAKDGLFSTDINTRRKAEKKLLTIFEENPPGTYLHVLSMYYGKKKSINWTASDTPLMDFRAGSLSFK